MSEKNTDALARIQERVNNLKKEEATQYLHKYLNVETLHYFEVGAILQRCHDEWYAEKADYESFVHNELRITLEKAARLRRTYLSIKAAQLTEADLRGITVSAIETLRPILESPKQSEHVQDFLERARTLGITALKDEVRKHLHPDREPPAEKTPEKRFAEAAEAFANKAEGSTLYQAEKALKVLADQFPTLWFHVRVTNQEEGDVRLFSFNEPEPVGEVVASLERLQSEELAASAEAVV